ncbi:MAG TPA: hypothetical protein VMR25_06255 [Planctomycetaceae bacterium]|nr:hypothetical protein [Planctomycetaceae bacterium]
MAECVPAARAVEVVAGILAAGLLEVVPPSEAVVFVVGPAAPARAVSEQADRETGDSRTERLPALAIDRQHYPPTATWDRIGQTSAAIGPAFSLCPAMATAQATEIDPAAGIDPTLAIALETDRATDPATDLETAPVIVLETALATVPAIARETDPATDPVIAPATDQATAPGTALVIDRATDPETDPVTGPITAIARGTVIHRIVPATGTDIGNTSTTVGITAPGTGIGDTAAPIGMPTPGVPGA